MVTENKSVVLVLAQITPMKTDNQHVQNVLKNVKSVLTCQTTVLFVLKEELTHQNVNYQTQLLNLLLLKMSQLDPSKLLTVLADVKHVKSKDLTV
jgi:nucleoside-triphosphatase THEP1